MRRGYIASAIILLSLALLLFLWTNTPKPLPPSNVKPLFLGYRSNTIRLDALNLTRLSQRARDSGYNVTVGQRMMSGEYVEGNMPTKDCNFQLSYSDSANYTYFHLSYPENSNVTGWLWDTLKDSLNLTDTQMRDVKEGATSQWMVDAGGTHLGTYIDGVRPDWVRLARHLGVETGRDNELVGVVRITFDSGAVMTLYSDALLIRGKGAGNDAVCVLNIDSDSDLCLYVDSSIKLVEPIKMFSPMFTALGVPESELSRLSLEESWAYPL